FFVELAHTAFNHLFDDCFWLARFTSLLDEDVLFTLSNSCVNFFGANSQWVCCCNVHCNLTTDCVERSLVTCGLKRNENAELAKTVSSSIVNICGNNAIVHFELKRATQSHVFTNSRNCVLDGVCNRLASCWVVCSCNSFNSTVCVE